MEKLGFVTMHENSIRTDKFVRYKIYKAELLEYDGKTNTNINTEYKFILGGETEDGEFQYIDAFDDYIYAKEVRDKLMRYESYDSIKLHEAWKILPNDKRHCGCIKQWVFIC